jgi:hypothetical protein
MRRYQQLRIATSGVDGRQRAQSNRLRLQRTKALAARR